MNDDFRFSVMSAKHRKLFLIHKLIVLVLILTAVFIGVKITNPVIVSETDKVSVALGAIVGAVVAVFAVFNRIKTLMKVKFTAFLIIWTLLMCLDQIMDTMKWTIGLVLIPLAIDDLFLLPFWRNVWYNNYER